MKTYTNSEKDVMMEKVKSLAEEITGKTWRNDGGCVASEDDMMSINVYDYMNEFTEMNELENLKEYVLDIINEERMENHE